MWGKSYTTKQHFFAVEHKVLVRLKHGPRCDILNYFSLDVPINSKTACVCFFD